MAKVTAQEYVEDWSRNLKGATERIKRGINRVTEAPGAKAAAQKELLKMKLIEAIDSGKWSERVAGVTLDEWKDKILSKGVNRIAAGVDAAKSKQVAMAGNLLAAVDSAVAEANRTPRGTLEDNINRMTTYVRAMHGKKIK